MAKAPADRFASADEVEAALSPWCSHDGQPLEHQGDAAFQLAVQRVIEAWTPPEAAREAVEDALLFRVDPAEKPPPSEFLSRSIFSEIDRYKVQLSVIIAIVIWVSLLLCGLASFFFSVPL